MRCLLTEDRVTERRIMLIQPGLLRKDLLDKSNGIPGIFSPNSEIIGTPASTLAAAAALTGDGNANIFLFT